MSMPLSLWQTGKEPVAQLVNYHYKPKTNKQWLEYHVPIAVSHAQDVQVPESQQPRMALSVALNVFQE